MATGRTAEGTIWTTRPMSPEVIARYACIHRGGIVPCEWGSAEACEEIRQRTTWIAPPGAKVKPYSPRTPEGYRGFTLPASVGEGFQEGHARAIRRLAGLEPWPEQIDRVPKRSLPPTDAAFTRVYREFCASVLKSGGQLRRYGLLPQRWEIVSAWPAIDDEQAIVRRKPRRSETRAPRAQRVKHPAKRPHECSRDHGAAARKAWATRHARNDNGSASALKAWATRRRLAAA